MLWSYKQESELRQATGDNKLLTVSSRKIIEFPMED